MLDYCLVRVLSLISICTSTAGAVYEVDPTRHARRFDGIGALSGGGATSRLLADYAEPYASQVLDILYNGQQFKPNFGASLHILKHEIGGDTFSGCGTEPSHMHTRQDLNTDRGYEWWLMDESTKRNPAILRYGLPWGFPSWIGNGGDIHGPGHLLTQDQADYITAWVRGAEVDHQKSMHYIGIWNEMGWSTDYVKLLRATLDKGGFNHTSIVVSDNAGGSFDSIAAEMKADSAFARAVGVIGVHYPVASQSTTAAANAGVPLWASEDSSTYDDEAGGGCWARILNWNYVKGNMTSTIMWNLVTSYYKNLRWYGDSLMDASEPWSGHYVVQSPIWATAHTTQFTAPGWIYLQHGYGTGELLGGGTYVSLTSPSGDNLTIVVETMTKEHSQCIRSNPSYPWAVVTQNVTFRLPRSLSGQKLSVWKSVLFPLSLAYTFAHQPDVVPDAAGLVSFTLEPDAILTVSTTSGQAKGDHGKPPPSASFPAVYLENFEDYAEDTLARFFSDMCGSFSVAMRNDGSGKALQQQILYSPSIHKTGWNDQDSKQPLTIIGDWNTSNVTVNVSVFLSELSNESSSGDPLLSLVTCDVSNPAQQWLYNAPAYYHSSLSNVGDGQCMDVLKSDPYPVWMWPCERQLGNPGHFDISKSSVENSEVGRSVTGRRLLQSVDNQQWTFLPSGELEASGYLVPGQPAHWCLDGSTLHLQPCSSGTPRTAALWSYDPGTRLVKNGDGQCLSSSPPALPALSRMTVGVRLGGPISPDASSPPGVVRAYNTNWYDWGYYFSITAVGQFELARGSVVVAAGSVPGGAVLRKWRNITLSANGAVITATIDGTAVVHWTDPDPSDLAFGWVGLGSGWHRAQFDNFIAVRD